MDFDASIILQEAESYVTPILKPLHDLGYHYHNLRHTQNVHQRVKLLAKHYNLNKDESFELEIAALFHDTGIHQDYDNHEEASKLMAAEYLSQKIPEETLQRILKLIDATKAKHQAQNLQEQIIRDADLYNLADDSYFDVLKQLKKEQKIIKTKEWNGQQKFLENAISFSESHEYNTEYAQQFWSDKKIQNQNKLKAIIMETKKSKSKKKTSLLDDNKVGQMILKTSLRNHIDLSSLADSKASTMLSVNTLILTLAIPLMLPRIYENKLLSIPTAILLLTSILTITYATLVTRPLKMKGYTSDEDIRAGKGDLFFFGNFFKMNFTQYLSGMQSTLSNADNLDESIIRDLFGSGQALGIKYGRLRICYMIFITGVVISGLGFLLIILMDNLTSL